MKINTIITLIIVASACVVVTASRRTVNKYESDIKQTQEINKELLKANKSLAELCVVFKTDINTIANEYQILHGKYTNLQSVSSVKIENFKQQ